MPYSVRVSVPGDPNWITDPPAFDDARKAWEWLADYRRNSEDEYPDWHIGEYTDTVGYLEYAATDAEFGNPHEDYPLAADGTGTIGGDTPGEPEDSSGPGLDYSVVIATRSADTLSV